MKEEKGRFAQVVLAHSHSFGPKGALEGALKLKFLLHFMLGLCSHEGKQMPRCKKSDESKRKRSVESKGEMVLTRRWCWRILVVVLALRGGRAGALACDLAKMQLFF